MKFYLLALIFSLSLGQLQRFQITNNVAFYLHDLLIVAYLLWELFTAILQRKKIIKNAKKIKIFQKKIFWLFILSIATSWTLAFIAHRFDWRAILYTIRFTSYLSFVYLLQKRLKNKSLLWQIISFNILLLGFVQYIFLPDLRFLIYEGYDDHLYRLTSTILDPAFTGLIFVFNINYYLWQKHRNWPIIFLFSLGLLLTYSRSSYLALVVSSLLLIFLRRDLNRKIITTFLLLFFICLPFLPSRSGGDGVNLLRTTSTQARISNDQQILQSLNGAEWLLGRGLFIPNNNRETSLNIPSHSHFADNLFVFLVSNLGILGTLTLAYLLYEVFKDSKRENLVLLVGLLIHAMFNNNLTESFVVLIFLGFCFSKN